MRLLILLCLVVGFGLQTEAQTRTPDPVAEQRQQEYQIERELKQLEKLADRLEQALNYPKTTTVSSLNQDIETAMTRVIELTGKNNLKEFLVVFQNTTFRQPSNDGTRFKAVDLTNRFVEWARRE